MDKTPQQTLSWFIHFAQLDLEKLFPGEKAKLLIEAEEYLFPDEDEVQAIRAPTPLPFGGEISPTEKDKLDKLWEEKVLREGLGKMFWAFKPKSVRDSQGNWLKICKLQKAIKQGIADLVESKENNWCPFNIIHPANVAFIAKKEPGHSLKISYIPLGKNQEEYLYVKMLMLLKDSEASILKCGSCNKIFLNTSRRKKKFCSAQCTWRFNADKRRKADPDGYREYQKQVMADKRRREAGLKTKRFYK